MPVAVRSFHAKVGLAVKGLDGRCRDRVSLSTVVVVCDYYLDLCTQGAACGLPPMVQANASSSAVGTGGSVPHG